MTTERLETAVAEAVRQGRQAAKLLRQKLDEAARRLDEASTGLGRFRPRHSEARLDEAGDAVVLTCTGCRARNRCPTSQLDQNPVCAHCRRRLALGGESTAALASSAIAKFTQTVASHREHLDDLFRRQECSLATFNMVFFGRTGTGKSSLLEALSRGDGASVSNGDLDFTEDVREVDWCACRLVDTPGIEGWGRRRPREELERTAQRAVETADVVILCFDTLSQLEGEFRKVADWVRACGKPAIAALNVKNTHWRKADRVPGRSERRSLSTDVREHAGHIRSHLEAIGLPGVPVVALSARQAVFACARDPYAGPNAEGLRAQRAKYGLDQLRRISNVEALEDLLIGAIELDAPGLRLAMLRRALRTQLGSVSEELGDLAERSTTAAKSLESLIERSLRVIGYPAAELLEARTAFADPRVASDMLSELEALRGQSFEAATAGELQTFLGQLLEARLSALRTRSLRAAEQTIDEGFREGREVSAEEFQARVFDQDALASVAREVIAGAQSLLERKVSVAVADVRTDLAWEMRRTRIDGSAGAQARNQSRWLKIATVAAGVVASATFVFAAPLAVLSTIGAFLFGIFSKRARREAEEKRAQARREAFASAGQSVHEVFAHVSERVAAEGVDLARRALESVLVGPVETAVALRLVAREARRASGALGSLSTSIEASDPAEIFRRAVHAAQERRCPGDPWASAKVWLGEDWVDDREGLHDEGDVTHVPLPAAQQRPSDGTFERLRDVLLAVPCPSPDAGAGWLAAARAQLANDPRAEQRVREIEQLAAGPPQVHVLGDYNVGKSSLIRRLLVDAEQPVPAELEVGATPTTTAARAYAWQGLMLVDTPGFQSNRSHDAHEALRGVCNAAIVLYVASTGVMIGDTTHLDALFRCDVAKGNAGKLLRTLFVLNRSDETVTADPSESGDDFLRARERKADELVAALAGRSIQVDRRAVVSVASDPYALRSRKESRAAVHSDYDPYRTWDNMGALFSALQGVSELRRQDWISAATLHGARSRMTASHTTRRC